MEAVTDLERAPAGTPSLLRAINERTVLECVRRVGPISRAQIARETALSKPTVSQALASLEGAGLVQEAGRSKGGKGPTALLYELNPRAGWVVGIDVGRDWVRAAIADVTGQFVARRDERARVKSSRALITQIGAIAHALAADAGIRWRQVTFATVGSPGVFEPIRGQVALAYSLPGWGREGIVEAVQPGAGHQDCLRERREPGGPRRAVARARQGRRQLRLPAPGHRRWHGARPQRRALPGEQRGGRRGRVPAPRRHRPRGSGQPATRSPRCRGERRRGGRDRPDDRDAATADGEAGVRRCSRGRSQGDAGRAKPRPAASRSRSARSHRSWTPSS